MRERDGLGMAAGQQAPLVFFFRRRSNARETPLDRGTPLSWALPPTGPLLYEERRLLLVCDRTIFTSIHARTRAPRRG